MIVETVDIRQRNNKKWDKIENLNSIKHVSNSNMIVETVDIRQRNNKKWDSLHLINNSASFHTQPLHCLRILIMFVFWQLLCYDSLGFKREIFTSKHGRRLSR